MKLVKGKDLNWIQRSEVNRQFVNRFSVIGAGRVYQTDEEWLKAHAFYIRKDGHIANRPNHCEPDFMADYA